MSQKLRCYLCGRIIEDENEIVMKNIHKSLFLGWWYSTEERMPFHPTCWEAYRRKGKRETISILLFCAVIILVPLTYILLRFVLHLW